MQTNQIDSNEPIDPELTELIKQCDAFDAEMDQLSPDERKKRICANLGLLADASDEDIENALEADLLGDPSFSDLAEELAQAAQHGSLMSLPKMQLDESFVQLMTSMLKKYDSLAPVERRTKVLALYGLSADATDAELVAAVKQDFSDSCEEPIPEGIVQQCVTIILEKVTAIENTKSMNNQAATVDHTPAAEAVRCPSCSSQTLIPIVWGGPAPDDAAKVARGEIELGGCVMVENAPHWRCKSCQHAF